MYDRKCLEIAEDFLDDEPALKTPENAAKIAQAVQDAIEDGILSLRDAAGKAGA